MLGLSGCAHGLAAAPPPSRGALRSAGVMPPAEPTVLGPRLVPEAIDDEKAFGVEPGGGLRAIASGVRVVSLPSGALMAADDRLPYAPTSTTVLPERLGGGFLFVIGNVV